VQLLHARVQPALGWLGGRAVRAQSERAKQSEVAGWLAQAGERAEAM